MFKITDKVDDTQALKEWLIDSPSIKEVTSVRAALGDKTFVQVLLTENKTERS